MTTVTEEVVAGGITRDDLVDGLAAARRFDEAIYRLAELTFDFDVFARPLLDAQGKPVGGPNRAGDGFARGAGDG